MIFVYLDKSKIPPGWEVKAKALLAELEKCATPEERREFIDNHHKRNGNKTIWSELKGVLLEMSHGKCWYTEAKDDVSDWHVDHFRPKKRALELDGTEHEGYAWLAFDFENFRIAGSFPNSPHKDNKGNTRGKWDYFPLLPGGQRASWDKRDYSNEKPALLDPAKKGDAACIVFDEEAIPKPANEQSPLVKYRVEVTNELLFLDAPRLVEGRKRRWRECLRWIQELRDLTPLSLSQVDPQRFKQIARIENNIREMTKPDQPYASMIRSCLKRQGLDYLIETPEGNRG